ncbi:retrovirus-related pol polyprotein from transposon TNT 1-94 [Tanacetum coccineum]|uniref:Retrovirus-related pol polyprotein from transposon TNT 1-94 n=1 Tax=Tanacetum coccineum TaxID=301880 RepID=A0ABQ5GR13_9ASTR
MSSERRNKTLIEATRTMLNRSVLSKHFWTDAVRIACYTQNISIIVKSHDKTSYEIFMERIPDISYFHVFRCPVFIHNHKDHLAYFDASRMMDKLLDIPLCLKALEPIYTMKNNTIYETYHVTFDESMEAIRFTNTLVDEIGIDDSSRYPPDEFQKDVLSRQYQVDYDVLYYIIPHGCSLTKITQENHVPKVIAPNEPEIPYTKDDEGNNIEVSGSITKPLVPDVTQSHITSKPLQHAYKKHGCQAYNCLSKKNLISSIETKYRLLFLSLMENSHSQEEGIDFDETFAPVARMEAIRIFLAFAINMNFKVYQIDVKSAFLNDKLKEEVYVKQPPGFESSEFSNYACKLDKDFYGLNKAPMACIAELDVKGKFEMSMIVKTPMVPLNNLGPDVAGKSVNETSYRGMIRLLMYLTATRPDIQFSTVLCARYQSNLKESHLIVVKRILRDHILKGDIELHFIPTEYQLADIFTKPLDEPTFTRLKAELGMLNID